MKCPNCKKEVQAEWKTCPYCEFKPKLCSKPGCKSGWLPREAHFCPLCGSPVKGEEELKIRVVVEGAPDSSADNDSLEFTVGDVSFSMVFVEGGSFMMGAQSYDEDEENYDPDAFNDESPVHEVTLSDYHIGETPVTQELWEAVMGENPSECEGADRPVDNVSWGDCQSFLKKLNYKLRNQLPQGCKFQLPTEAQWEFAARGGNESAGYQYGGSDDIDEVAWYDDNSDNVTHPVMEKDCNELGIYDMSGNVWEWCQDWHDDYEDEDQDNPKGPKTGSDRVLRGGCWGSDAEDCRVAYRTYDSPGSRDGYTGFRLALVASSGSADTPHQ